VSSDLGSCNKSLWTNWLLDTFEVLGDKGDRGMKEVKITDGKELKRARQIVESLIGRKKVLVIQGGTRK